MYSLVLAKVGIKNKITKGLGEHYNVGAEICNGLQIWVQNEKNLQSIANSYAISIVLSINYASVTNYDLSFFLHEKRLIPRVRARHIVLGKIFVIVWEPRLGAEPF